MSNAAEGRDGVWQSSSTNQAFGTRGAVLIRSVIVLREPGVPDEYLSELSALVQSWSNKQWRWHLPTEQLAGAVC